MSTQAAIAPDDLQQRLWRELGQTLRYFLDDVESKTNPTEANLNAIVALGVFKLEELRRYSRIAALNPVGNSVESANGEAVSIETRLTELATAHLTRKDDTPIVAFVDSILGLAAEVGRLACLQADETALRFVVRGRHVVEFPLHRVLGLLRASCARLAMVCHEQSGQEFSPYGTEAEFDYEYAPGKRLHYSICTTNSPNHQGFLIETRPLTAPG